MAYVVQLYCVLFRYSRRADWRAAAVHPIAQSPATPALGPASKWIGVAGRDTGGGGGRLYFG